MVTRRDLRAERDFFSPMTGNTGTKIRYADAPRRKDTYGSEVKKRLADIKDIKSTRVNPIEAVFTKLIKTEDPFTQIDRKKSYAPEEEQDSIQEALGGAAETAEQVVGDAVGEVREVVRSTGQRASERRAAQQLKRQEQRKSDQAALDKRFTGVETGLSNLGKDYKAQEQRAIDNMAKFRAEQAEKFKASDDRFKSFSIAQIKRDIQQDIATRKTAQDAKTYEQNRAKQREIRQRALDKRISGVESDVGGVRSEVRAYETNREKQRRLTQARLKGIESKQETTKQETAQYRLNREKQRALRQQAVDQRLGIQDKRLGDQEKKLGEVQKTTTTTFGGVIDLKKSLAEIKARREAPKTVTIGGQKVAAKQSVASLPSNYKATEAEAFRVAKAYKEAKAIAERNPNVSVSVDSKGKPVAKAVQKTRTEAGARTAEANKARVQNNARARAQAAAVNRKLSGKSISQTKAANTASMKAAAAARHASFKKAKAAGTHNRTAAAQRAAKKNAAKQRAKNAAKARNKAKKASKKSGGCPDPMMLILMANGSQKRAGDLKVGDLIKTNHEKDMKLGEYKVEYVNVLNNREKAKFTFEESEIVCSLTHKFYVDNDWKEAKDMKIGDEVSGQKLIAIENVEDGDVVHITVEDAHTYICEGLLSHNKRCDIRTKDDISKLTDMNLLRDDLANVAYFVKELQETI